MATISAHAPVYAGETQIRRTPLERIEYAIIVSTLLLLVIVTVQPMLNLLAISLSDPSRVAGFSGLAILPDGLSLDVWTLLVLHEVAVGVGAAV
jgi:putative aldouronate transport system permease protein